MVKRIKDSQKRIKIFEISDNKKKSHIEELSEDGKLRFFDEFRDWNNEEKSTSVGVVGDQKTYQCVFQERWNSSEFRRLVLQNRKVAR